LQPDAKELAGFVYNTLDLDRAGVKLLAVSDIHGNVEAVHLLRERERNVFDAVIVAGDIGGGAAPEILNILASFACPIMYVFGNWDNQLPYDTDFGSACHHLHLRSVECGGWAFAGFSGLPTSWGMNPIAKALKEGVKRKDAVVAPDDEVLRLNRRELAAVINGSRVGQVGQ
jgi:Icc-related predicted phosphoesterase